MNTLIPHHIHHPFEIPILEVPFRNLHLIFIYLCILNPQCRLQSWSSKNAVSPGNSLPAILRWRA